MTPSKDTSIMDWKRLRPQVTAKLLQEITHRIVERFHPEKIILFGSYAYGDATPQSDVDLLVVMKSDERPAKRSTQVTSVCRPRYLSMDVIVLTPEELEHRLAGFDPFLEEALSKGKVLYDASR
ncbi:MAG: nucleotidyltransferase domain-containing protein [Candidatus Poribacteria bacterium]|nr:nucleotidyltransferase domain-containing protein [Candidatus Poribacteria bacterium]